MTVRPFSGRMYFSTSGLCASKAAAGMEGENSDRLKKADDSLFTTQGLYLTETAGWKGHAAREKWT